MAQRSIFIIDRDTLEILLDLPAGMTLLRADFDESQPDEFFFTVETDNGIPSNTVAQYEPNDVGSLTLMGFVPAE